MATRRFIGSTNGLWSVVRTGSLVHSIPTGRVPLCAMFCRGTSSGSLESVLKEVAGSQRVLVKLGTAVLTRDDECGIALGRLASIVEQISEMQNSGRNCIVVTSGSVGFGKMLLREQQILSTPIGNMRNRNAWDPDARAAAAVGQPSLMALYHSMFRQYGLRCAQVLVTQRDFDLESTRNNLKSTVEELMRLNIIPLVNENDVVSQPPAADSDLKGTISLKDNDSLASLVAVNLKVQVLLCLSDVDGVYTAPPGSKGARLLSSYNPGEGSDGSQVEFGEKSSVGRGGMEAKLGAALFAARKGVQVIIANGFRPNVILDVLHGSGVGTVISTDIMDSTPVPSLSDEPGNDTSNLSDAPASEK